MGFLTRHIETIRSLDLERKKRLGLIAFAAVLLLGLALFAAPALTQDVVMEGTWTTKGFDVDGTWKIVREGGKTWVVLDDAFNTKSAPDLKIFLSPNPASGLDNRNATQGSTLVAELKSNRGAQRYEIPAGVDVRSFRAIAIHCEKYTKLWAAADLQ